MAQKQPQSEKLLRLIARGWSVVMILFVLFFSFAHIFAPDTAEAQINSGFKPEDIVAMFFFPLGATIGLALSWKKELLGSIVTILSVFVFYLIIAFPRGAAGRMLPTMLIIYGSSLLFLWLGMMERNRKK